MPDDDILVEQRDRIVSVTLNRPDRMNAITTSMSSRLVDIFTAYRDDPDQWVMVITGAGDRAFCSGVDVSELREQSDEAGSAEGYTSFKPWTDIMQSIHKPFICAVNGACVGGGWHFVADSDVIFASEAAQFLDTHVNVGLVNGVESAGLARKMPLGVVMRMVIEGRHFRVSADQAYTWGLVSEVVPSGQLQERAWEIAEHIATESAPLAVQSSKKAILGALDRGLSDGIEYAWTVLDDIRHTQDAIEGPRAFAEKRKPNFQGR